MEQVFSELTFWHWLALGLILFGIEMMSGTFDLLMVAIAAWLTAGFAYFAPDAWTVWQGQMIVFGVASTALVVFGRTVLSGVRKSSPEHPTLNRRMQALVGERGLAVGDFVSGTDGDFAVNRNERAREVEKANPQSEMFDPEAGTLRFKCKQHKVGHVAQAVSKLEPEVATRLIDKGAEVNHVNECTGSALTYSCEKGLAEIAMMLIDKGADVNQAGAATGAKPLHIAAQYGQVDAAKLLLGAGAYV